MEEKKTVHTVILDAGPLIKNDPPVSTLLKHSHRIVTIPQVVAEIRDENTRSRLDTLLKPFLDVRDPRPSSIRFITDFARRTGDLAVLSRPDILLLALTYEIECERSGGDWRLRRMPAQKGLNGVPPTAAKQQSNPESEQRPINATPSAVSEEPDVTEPPSTKPITENVSTATEDPAISSIGAELSATTISDPTSHLDAKPTPDPTVADPIADDESESEGSDGEGWITPSNLKKQQAKDASPATAKLDPDEETKQAALLTTDYAMQNVALQVNLHLVATNFARIRKINTYILRCHACFEKVKDMTKQFCPRCGKPALTRVACSTNAAGEFRLHLKKNFQYNTRGDRYSIPKPVGGSASGKLNVGGGGKGGGKGGWGQDLILTEDQREYEKAIQREQRTRQRDVMDEDRLPDILTGDRSQIVGRPRVGAGRNINAKKRR